MNFNLRALVVPILASVVLAACQTDGPNARGVDGKIPDPVSTLPRVTQPTVFSSSTSTSIPPDSVAVEPDAAEPSSTTSTTLPPALPPPNSQFSDLKLGFEQISAIEKVTGIAWLGDAMFASTQPGPIFRIDGETVEVALDLTADTHRFQPGSERGVLGVAIDPRNQRLFVNYTDQNDDTLVVSYELENGVAALDSRREVLFIDQPGLGHNGGRLYFDRLGNLLISSGDGGASSGWDAQDTTKLLGAILRVTPNLDSPGYSIPPDNPNADGVADRPEVIARGFRNPWSFAVDEPTGEIWIGDVGNTMVEELSVLRRVEWGANFGWP
ncbi:MAG: PQQ-dependent sugar dehydrogenase, partial [Acidimicrobiaceae bacterium]